MSDRFTVEGQVTTADGSGVHGISIDLYDRDLLFYEVLGSVITRADGRFQATFEQDPLEALFDASPEILITVKDATGKKLHTAEQGQHCQLGTTIRFDVKLSDESLQDHFRAIKSLAPSEGGLLPQRHLETIALAWNTLSQERGGTGAFQRNALYCPGPPIIRFGDLVTDAVGVIKGRPEALERFQDKLTTMAAATAPDPEREARLASYSADELEDPTRWRLLHQEMSRAAAVLPRAAESIFPEDGMLAVMAAAWLAGGGDPKASHRNLGIIQAQICDAERLGPVVRSAEHFRIDPGKESLGRFNRAWTDYFDMWGPDDGPPRPQPGPEPSPGPNPKPWPDPWPPKPGGFPRDPGALDRLLCLVELIMALRQGLAYVYSISSISPARACPGDTITINGSGFDAAGRVRFSGKTGSISVDPLSWSNTQITVVVPPDAICGQISLVIHVQSVIACDKVIDIYKRNAGLTTHFEGGETWARRVSFYDTTDSGCTRPGVEVGLSWSTCNAKTVSVEVRDDTGTVVFSDNAVSADGTRLFSLPNYNQTRKLTATVSVTGPCGTDNKSTELWVQSPYDLSVDGIEVTQGIQYYRAAQHLTFAADRRPDNSLQLVTGKRAWVRVYVRSGQAATFEGGALRDVDGQLQVFRITGGVSSLVATLLPMPPGSVTAQANPAYAAERGNIAATLNFVIPANVMTGQLRLVASVNSAYVRCGNDSDSSEVTVNVDLTQTLRVAGIMVAYNGVDAAGNPLVLGAPTIAQLTTALGYSLAVMPVQATPTVRNAGTVTLTNPLNDARTCPGCCSNNWATLNNQVAAQAANDGNQANWLYYGIVPSLVPIGVSGCQSNGVSSGPLNQTVTMAHELCHQMGRAHAPCGAVGASDPGYPAYEPYDPLNTPNASLGEYGLDVRSGIIRAPNTNSDFMSYCNFPANQWVSIWTHNGLIGATNLPSTRFTVGGAGARAAHELERAESWILLLGMLDEDEQVVVQTMARVQARNDLSGKPLAGVQAELLDADGKKLAWSRVYATVSEGGNGEDCGCQQGDPQTPCALRAMIPDVAAGAMLRIRRSREEVLWSRSAPVKAPTINVSSAGCDESGRLSFAWKAEADSSYDPEIWARWSADQGATWHGLAVGLKGDSATLDAPDLPPGPVRLELCIQDGFYAARATAELTVPARPPTVAIIHPAQDDVIAGNAQLLACGAAHGCDGVVLADDACGWRCDGKEVGRGFEVFVSDLDVGEHRLELVAHDEHGSASADVAFQVRE